jgi:hypothetical protein
VQRFLAGEAKVFIMSLRSGAGSTGCSTSARPRVRRARLVAGHARPVHRAAEPRGPAALGPEDGLVDAIFLVADDGSDPPMMEMLGLKASQAHHIVDGGLGPQRKVEDRAPIERLIERYLGQEAAA